MSNTFGETIGKYTDVIERTYKLKSIIREYDLLLSMMDVYDTNKLNSVIKRSLQMDPIQIVKEFDTEELLAYTMFKNIFERIAKVFEEAFNMPDLVTYTKLRDIGIVAVGKEILEAIFQIQVEIDQKSRQVKDYIKNM